MLGVGSSAKAQVLSLKAAGPRPLPGHPDSGLESTRTHRQRVDSNRNSTGPTGREQGLESRRQSGVAPQGSRVSPGTCRSQVLSVHSGSGRQAEPQMGGRSTGQLAPAWAHGCDNGPIAVPA